MNKIEQRIAEDRATMDKSERYARFAAILARFEREFGEENIRWMLGNYNDDLGVAYMVRYPANIERGVSPMQHRIAYKFHRHTSTPLHEEAAVAHLREWIKDPQCPPGVLDDNCLEGNEIGVAYITMDPRVEAALKGDFNRVILVEP